MECLEVHTCSLLIINTDAELRNDSIVTVERSTQHWMQIWLCLYRLCHHHHSLGWTPRLCHWLQSCKLLHLSRLFTKLEDNPPRSCVSPLVPYLLQHLRTMKNDSIVPVARHCQAQMQIRLYLATNEMLIRIQIHCVTIVTVWGLYLMSMSLTHSIN